MKKSVTKSSKKSWIAGPSGLMEGRPFLTSESEWPRFTEYEFFKPVQQKIFEARSVGSLFIRPKPQSRLEYYKPFSEFPQILREALRVGDEISALDKSIKKWQFEDWDKEWDKIDKQRGERLLSFINRYGLVGLFWHKFETVFWDYKLPGFMLAFSGELAGLEPLAEYYERFQVDPASFLEGPDRPFPRWPTIHDEKFLRHYAEPVDWLYEEFLLLPGLDRLVSNPNTDFNLEKQLAPARSMEELLHRKPAPPRPPEPIGPLQLSMRKNGSALHYEFVFPSLLMAVQIMCLRNQVEVSQPLKKCPIRGCGYFIATRPNNIYCPRHLDSSALRMARKRKRDKEKDLSKQTNPAPLRRAKQKLTQCQKRRTKVETPKTKPNANKTGKQEA